MQNRNNQGRVSAGFIAGVIAAILVTGGGAAWWAYRSLIGSDTPDVIQTQPDGVKTPDSPEIAPLEEKAQVYWLPSANGTSELVATPVMLQKSVDSNEALKTAITTLLAGPTDETYATTIPSGTRLLDFKMAQDGVHLNLSQAFTEGGGSASMEGRLKQILYTATSVDPNQSVWLSVEGQPLEVLGGEGLMVGQPMTRQWFEQEYGWGD